MIKSARSMAGLPWIAAMAFFMQSLDATILNTALPAIATQNLHDCRFALYPWLVSLRLVAFFICSGYLPCHSGRWWCHDDAGSAPGTLARLSAQ